MLQDRWESNNDHEESVAFKHWYKTEGIHIEKRTENKTKASVIIKISNTGLLQNPPFFPVLP